jgi:long-chain acyl-CoA synthetase
MERFPFGAQDTGLSFLPLCHIYGRIVDYCYFHRGVTIAYAEKFDLVPQYLLEVRPTVAAAVPRFFEKMYARIMEAIRAAPWHAQKQFRWAMDIARRSLPYRRESHSLPPLLQAEWDLADLLVYSRLRKALGGRIRFFVSGGAPLSPALIEFFLSLGIEIYQGYGLTEASPVISTNIPGQNRIGTVGKSIPGVDVRIAEDREILSRGPNTMLGYYRDPDGTRAGIQDGWLHTGDLGYLDPEGYLVITDRKKDLIKTAGGKYVAPQLIENKLKTNPFIQDVVILGDRRKFVCALIVPNFRTLGEFARQQSLDWTDRAMLLRHPAVRRLYEEQIEALCQDLSQHEKVKQFRLLDQELSYEGGELTFTMKIRRRVVEQRFAALIDQIYAEAEAVYPST